LIARHFTDNEIIAHFFKTIILNTSYFLAEQKQNRSKRSEWFKSIRTGKSDPFNNEDKFSEQLPKKRVRAKQRKSTTHAYNKIYRRRNHALKFNYKLCTDRLLVGNINEKARLSYVFF